MQNSFFLYSAEADATFVLNRSLGQISTKAFRVRRREEYDWARVAFAKIRGDPSASQTAPVCSIARDASVKPRLELDRERAGSNRLIR